MDLIARSDALDLLACHLGMPRGREVATALIDGAVKDGRLRQFRINRLTKYRRSEVLALPSDREFFTAVVEQVYATTRSNQGDAR